MRASRIALLAVVCAAILAVGYVASPKELPTLQLVVPAGTSDGGASAEPTP